MIAEYECWTWVPCVVFSFFTNCLKVTGTPNLGSCFCPLKQLKLYRNPANDFDWND